MNIAHYSLLIDTLDLFSSQRPQQKQKYVPLAERIRPQVLQEFVGQQHILGEGKALQQMIEHDELSSIILWGPPGSGKTTLAKIIANTTHAHFIFFSAVMSGVPELRKVIKETEAQWNMYGKRTVLFVDEIHRLNKLQQDAFLPHVENGTITLIGATTENPSFEVNRALLSRCQVYVLHQLEMEDIVTILTRAVMDLEKGVGHYHPVIQEEIYEELARYADGDTRIALNYLELLVLNTEPGEEGEREITLDGMKRLIGKKILHYDKHGEEHYTVISAFIKSMRGSDPDASVYYLARMLENGEDPMFIARRMVILASEDIGNADPQALQVAVAAMQAVHFVGLPEAQLTLTQAALYLALAPKSNAVLTAIHQARADVREYGSLPVPLHLRNAPTQFMKDLNYGEGYKYAHDYDGGWVEQNYLPEALKGRRYYSSAKNKSVQSKEKA